MFRDVVATTLVLLAVLTGGAAADASRIVERDYMVGTAPDCGLPDPFSAKLCIPVRPGEATVSLVVEESSPTRGLGPIAVRTDFLGVDSAFFDFCDGVEELWIEPGATHLYVEIRQGQAGGFCQDDAEGLSLPVRGLVTARFS